MNYLAHLLLAGEDPARQVGSLLGDFLGDTDLESLPEAVRAGVEQHFQVDAYCNHHPAFRRARKRLYPHIGHYAGPVADIFFDHCLAQDWTRWRNLPLSIFSQMVYDHLDGFAPWLGPKLQAAAPRMREVDLLASYRHLAGMQRALRHLRQRARNRVELAPCLSQLETGKEVWRRDFHHLMTDLQKELGA
ncbi:MAG: DUF479 domain-containing protein [Planctomycetota bacterium]|nr:MAG: DUF479 domain-containing protein [Planctomycetota bacterium]